MKSLLSQAFFVPDVHQRLRKRLARCTLDCGSKTSESPALRGFVAERGPIKESRERLYTKCKEKGLQLIATRVTDSDALEVTVL